MNKAWLKAALVRSVKTIAQTAIATIGTTAGNLAGRLVDCLECISTGRNIEHAHKHCRVARSRIKYINEPESR